MAIPVDDDGEHCPICGVVVLETECNHYLTDDDSLDDFAGDVPAELTVLVDNRDLQEDDQLLAAATHEQRALIVSVIEHLGDSRDYWMQTPGVVVAFFEGDRPGGSSMSYWHPDAKDFTARLKAEASAAIAWLQEQTPGTTTS